MCVCCRHPLLCPPAPVTCLRTPPSCACLCAQSLSPAMRPTTQPHPSAISFSAVPCEIDYSEPYSGGGRFVIPFGAVCYPFGISAYQVCISYVSAVYQCRRTFAFLIRLYQGVSGMCFLCISSVSVTWVPPTLIRCIRVYQECIRHVSGMYQEGCFFYTLIHS